MGETKRFKSERNRKKGKVITRRGSRSIQKMQKAVTPIKPITRKIGVW